MRKASDIQFAPIEFKPKPPPEPPGWLKAIFEFLEDLLKPLGKLFGVNASVVMWILGGIIALCVLVLIWRIVQPLIERRRAEAAEAQAAEWVPERGAVLMLLEDADRLAAAGRFDEATHLLLKRSISQIAAARPDWLHPATTAREIAGNSALPDRARTAFATIATRVERSIFALIPLAADDWNAARSAYADFALAEIPA